MSEDNDNNITYIQANDLRVGGHILDNKRACVILSMSRSKTGKHGSAKISLEIRDIFNNKRGIAMYSSSEKVAVPIIQKSTYRVISVSDDEFVSMMSDKGDIVESIKLPINELGENIKKLLEKNSDEKGIDVVVLTAMNESQIVSVSESKD